MKMQSPAAKTVAGADPTEAFLDLFGLVVRTYDRLEKIRPLLDEICASAIFSTAAYEADRQGIKIAPTGGGMFPANHPALLGFDWHWLAITQFKRIAALLAEIETPIGEIEEDIEKTMPEENRPKR